MSNNSKYSPPPTSARPLISKIPVSPIENFERAFLGAKPSFSIPNLNMPVLIGTVNSTEP